VEVGVNAPPADVIAANAREVDVGDEVVGEVDCTAVRHIVVGVPCDLRKKNDSST